MEDRLKKMREKKEKMQEYRDRGMRDLSQEELEEVVNFIEKNIGERDIESQEEFDNELGLAITVYSDGFEYLIDR